MSGLSDEGPNGTMSEEQSSQPGRQAGIGFTTNVSDQARIDTLVNAEHIDQLVLHHALPTTSLHQLPPDVAGFTGRTETLASVVQQFASGEDSAATPAIVAISGMAGVGKSALAIHLAHHLKDRFTDGQLYQRMRGTDSAPKSPSETLAEFLRSLGIVDTDIPPTLDERVALFRSKVESRRVLIVLDDVQDETQALPLLPGSATCGVLITSRQSLTALDSAYLYNLAEMRDNEAISLLQQFCGYERVQAALGAAQEIVRLCGRLPLAVRIVGGRLGSRPDMGLEVEAAALRDEQRRLERLSYRHLGVRSALMLTYNSLDEGLKGLFRTLGIVTWPDFPSPVPAYALVMDFEVATEKLERLIDLQLLEGFASGMGRRYRFHELVRLFARECWEQEVSLSEQQTQRKHIINGVAASASILYEHLTPWTHKALVEKTASAQGRDFDDMQREVLTTALTWFDDERDMLHVVARWAYEEGVWRATTALAQALMQHDSMRFRSEDAAMEEMQLLALKASQELDERKSEAQIRNNLHTIYRRQGRYDESLTMVKEALAIWKSEDNHIAVGQMTDNFAILVRQMGRPDLAAEWHRHAIALFEREIAQTGDEEIGHLLIVSTQHLAICCAMQGDQREAMRMFRKCRRLCRRHRDLYREAEALQSLGRLHIERGKAVCGRATILLNASLNIARELQDVALEGYTLYLMATAYRLKGDSRKAETAYRDALSKIGPDSPLLASINAFLQQLA